MEMEYVSGVIDRQKDGRGRAITHIREAIKKDGKWKMGRVMFSLSLDKNGKRWWSEYNGTGIYPADNDDPKSSQYRSEIEAIAHLIHALRDAGVRLSLSDPHLTDGRASFWFYRRLESIAVRTADPDHPLLYKDLRRALKDDEDVKPRSITKYCVAAGIRYGLVREGYAILGWRLRDETPIDNPQ